MYQNSWALHEGVTAVTLAALLHPRTRKHVTLDGDMEPVTVSSLPVAVGTV